MGRVNIDTEKVMAAAKYASDKSLKKAGYKIERKAKELLNVGGGKDHVPSDPGEPPHVQTGALRSSVESAMDQEGVVVIGPTEEYGAKHEFGLRNYPARPFMRPAFRESQKNILEGFKDSI